MNREITTKKEGKIKRLNNTCQVLTTCHHEVMVGSITCKKCPHHVRVIQKDGKFYVHCNHI